jgi:hypothetical protein
MAGRAPDSRETDWQAAERRRSERIVPLDKPARPVPPGSARAAVPAPQSAVEQALAVREGTEAAVLLGAPAGAMAATLLALLRQGDHVVADDATDGPVREFLQHELPLLGMAATFVAPGDARAWRQALRPTTRLLVVTCPATAEAVEPSLRTPRVLARDGGLVLVAIADGGPPGALPLQGVDVIVRPLPLGAGGDAAGIVAGPDAVVDEVRLKAVRWGTVATMATVRAARERMQEAYRTEPPPPPGAGDGPSATGS